MLAGGALALLTSSANAAISFSLETVPSNAGAAGPVTVFLVARDTDPLSTTAVPIGGLKGRFTDLTTTNGLKFNIKVNPDEGTSDLDVTGGIDQTGGYSSTARRPAVKGSFMIVNNPAVNVVDGEKPGGNPNDSSDNATNQNTGDPAFQTGLNFADFTSAAGSNGSLTSTVLHSAGGAILGAAVVNALDRVTFTGGVLLADGQPDITIPALDSASPVPEPTALCFLGVVGAGTLLRRRRNA